MDSATARYKNVKTLEQASKLYNDLGVFLATPTEGASRGVRKALRDEAKEVRRLLEQDFGDIVRGVTSGYRRVFTPGVTAQGTVRELVPTWTKRTHFTLNKPDKTLASAPLMLHVPLDPRTFEPVGAYYATSSKPQALSDAIGRLDEVRTMRQRRKPGQSVAQYDLQMVLEEIQAIDALLPTLQNFGYDARELTATRDKLIRRREELTAQKGTAGRSMGAGADGNG